MVVTRRAPAPMLTSRTNSSQPVPRLKHKTPHSDPYYPDVSSPLANGKTSLPPGQRTEPRDDREDSSSSSKESFTTRPKRKSRKSRKTGSSRFGGLVTQLFILCFLIYVAVVCPDDAQNKTPVCRGLAEYRRLVIEPYIIPPIQKALAHPSVAPYVEKVKPFADRAIRTTKPFVQRARYEFATRVVPQWNARVVPLWNKHAVPQLKRIDAHLAPYRARIGKEYEQRLGPYINRAMYTMRVWQQKARPYVILAAHKTYDGYQRARPYARPAWERFKLLIARLIVFLGQQRRRFVDPHVHKIWERVKELSSGSSKAPATTDIGEYVTARISKSTQGAASVASSISASEIFSVVYEFAQSTPVAILSAAVSSDVEQTPSPSVAAEPLRSVSSLVSGASSGPAVSSAASVHVSSLSLAIPSLTNVAVLSASLIVSESPSSASELAREALSTSSLAAMSVTDRLSSPGYSVHDAACEGLAHASGSAHDIRSAVSFAVSSITDQASAVRASSETAVTEVVTHSATALNQGADAELAAFYAELGLGDVLADPSTEPTAVHTETAEEKAAREEELAERQRQRELLTAQRRADIDSRHSKWEIELSKAVEANQKALRKALAALRKDAVAALEESREIKEEVDSLVEEAEMLLRGAEKYLQTLEKEARKDEEKTALWERVVNKVDEKFNQRLQKTETVVNGWYLGVVNKELAEVRKVAENVKDIADRGQADVGLDYAYLDDVTYLDWQRYHDLVRTSDNFTADAHAIQDGTHSSPPPNPVLPAIADLQSEVKDIVVGFETRLRRIKRTGERAFANHGVAVEPMHDAADESVSILPVEESDKSYANMQVPPVVIGRSKEEVMDALNRAADQDGDKTSLTEKPQAFQEPGNFVPGLVNHAGGGPNVPEPASLPVHEEL